MNGFLLVIHILGGTIALVSLVPVLVTSWGTGTRVTRRHALFGRLYAWSMVVALAAAYILAVRSSSTFLGAIAAFTTYLVASGWRWIRPKVERTLILGRGFAIAMIIAAILMVIAGARQLGGGDQLGVVLFVFAGIGSALAIQDLIMLRSSKPPRFQRVALHLGRMLGAAIATLTAVLVTNVSFEPEWLVWTLPSMVFAPMIAVRSTLVLSRALATNSQP